MWFRVLVISVLVCVAYPSFAGSSGGGGQGAQAEGLALVDPVLERSCIALRVDVPPEEALNGIRWFNGSASLAFPKVLVASGSGDSPSSYDSAITMAEQVIGQENDWTEIAFEQPVASVSGSLFVVLQFPPNYVPPTEGPSMGVGYREFEGQTDYFLSRDGDNWFKLSSNYEFLLVPVFVDRDPSVVALSDQRNEVPADELPELPEKTTFSAYPNPFNPDVQLKLELHQSAKCEVKIFDVRGMVVRELKSGVLPGGTTILTWNGRDSFGRSLGSGVYWAKAVLGDLTITKRLVMVK